MRGRTYQVFISDIHSDIDTLGAVFDSLRGFRLAQVYCLGDIVHNGTKYKGNRVIDLLRSREVISVKGNHDEINPDKSKLAPENQAFLAELPELLETDGKVLTHTSFRQPGFRIRTDEHRLEEVIHIASTHPNVKLAIHGQTHIPHVYEFDLKKKKGTAVDISRPVAMRRRHIYLVNPGALTALEGYQQTVGIIDTDQTSIVIKPLGDLQQMQKQKNLLLAFEESWMPNLVGDNKSWASFGQDAQAIAKTYTEPQYQGVVKLITSHNLAEGVRDRKGYFNNFTFALAAELDRVCGTDVVKMYDVTSAKETRAYHLKRNL